MSRAAAVLIAALLGPGPAARAADPETRTFAVTVDGKPAGTFTMTARAADDGAETVSVAADVLVRVGPIRYTYTLRSVEVWRGDRVVSVEATANDDGKRHAVRAVAAGDGLTVTADGRTRAARADVVTSTGWRLPGPADRPRDVVVLDTENGAQTAARVDPLPPARVVVAGAPVDARRVRLTGKDLDAVWWFDAAGRPVRQEMKWDGHRVVLELTAVGR